jgi:hypothetical protein
MTVSCLPRSEEQLRRILVLLKESGLNDRYEEQARGEHILLSVHTRTLEEKELVCQLFQRAGISALTYREDAAA